jgi:large subunit ribosomal protein L37Ae
LKRQKRDFVASNSIRYGASIRKRVAAVTQKKHMKYTCEACGHTAVRRSGTSIWTCRHCNAVFAGGAFTMTTPEGQVARRLIEDAAKSAAGASR